MKALCHIETPFPEKFGVPRQPLLVKEAWGRMVFPKNDFTIEAFRGMEEVSHLWLIFEFHLAPLETNGLVRPPRFEGKTKLGVFATRSPHRPNRLGLSVVEFVSVEIQSDAVVLNVRGVDLVNGTPILDIKPYIPYCDRVEAKATYFDGAPTMGPVKWGCDFDGPEKGLIEKVIALDPRPAHDRVPEKEFGVTLAGLNVRFKSVREGFVILSIKPV